MASSIPTIKFEGDHNVKMEDVNSPSAASEQYADDVEDDPELNTENAHKILWMSKLPKYLWEALENANDDDEIEIGTIRVEGAFDNPERVSLMLNNAQNFQSLEKEYVLKKQTGPTRKIKRPGQVLMFSEKNKPGYKPRASFWDDIDEDGNPGQGRSQLYEQGIKDEKRKESKGRYTPYQRKPIPKITALSGTVFQEFEAAAVDNAEHRRLDGERTRDALKVKEKAAIEIKDDMDAKLHYGSMVTASERQNIVRSGQNKRAAAKENRTTQEDKAVVIPKILDLFRQHKYWGLRDLRLALRQPEQSIKNCLEDIAVMHRAGDFNGKWELKPDLKVDDDALLNALGEAPKMEESDMDMKSEGEDDDFEDVDTMG
ncbi:hypothetical protein LTS08_002037 [Lithohypha guttulata]|uniref:uncharacterized protein n=1 Tax=Lithohypha guttulata TaxID=1690604 RepID=UPI002DDE22CC|nr:hypothetical protein LTR51_004446 [Lithohypha guttulata]KAK5104152.1 hypothetical protein LTS08_002037 [Lithohypha guttulata]